MPAPIEEYISELLYEHECVVVPGFGGFIGNYSPARIDPVKHLFEPPGKNILFNKGLVQNDGLLAHHISQSQNVSYTTALEYIAKEVKHIQSTLQQHKRIALDSIGLFYTDEHGALLFQPDGKVNYLPEAFGLSAFYRSPVSQTEQEVKVIPLPKTGSSFRKWAAAAALGAVVASVAWLSLNTRYPGIDYSSLNIFAKKEARHYKSVSIRPISTSLYSKDSIAAVAFLNNIETNSIPDASVKNTNPAGGNFLIIAGCFRFLENAQSLVKKMQQEQVKAAIIGTNPQGLYMVGCGKFDNMENAESQLDSFRKNHIADAWVYRLPALQKRY